MPFFIRFQVSSTAIGPGRAGACFEKLRSPSGLPSLPKTATTSLSKPETIYTEDVTEPVLLISFAAFLDAQTALGTLHRKGGCSLFLFVWKQQSTRLAPSFQTFLPLRILNFASRSYDRFGFSLQTSEPLAADASRHDRREGRPRVRATTKNLRGSGHDVCFFS